MLNVDNLAVSFQAVEILRGVSLALPDRAVAGLIGRNGAGKTTFMRALMGLVPARSGSASFGERNLLDMAAHERGALGIGYMPEDRRLVPELSVEENVLLPAWALARKDGNERLQRIYALIPEVKQFKDRRAMQLSGGQQKLVALARALMSGTRLLLLDEPFEGVAPALAKRLVDVVASLKSEGLSVIVSESDLQHCAPILDRVFRIDRGAITQVS
jgi:branched-chain amino acid transport system ATP-binding protein